MSLASCHESRLMISNFHKKQLYKDFMNNSMTIKAYFVLLYESRVIQNFIELVFMSHTSSLMKDVYGIHFYEPS